MTEQFRFWVGVDWGDERHEVCVLDAQRGVRLQRAAKHTGDDIARRRGIRELLDAEWVSPTDDPNDLTDEPGRRR